MDIKAILSLVDWQLVLLVVFTSALAVQLFYYLFFFLRFAFYRPKPIAYDLPPVSVIICAWNEEDNLKKNLHAVLSQDYPEFEVIVVNDHSFDDTELLVQSWQKKYNYLRVIELNSDNAKIRGKKFAVSMGIKGAKYDHLVLTDADCRPKTAQWLRHMASGFSESKQLVLGYGGYEAQPGILNKLYRYEAVVTAMQYFSYAMAGIPYMGVGRNLAYKKELFYATKGFIKHRHVSSGDDDLMVNEIARGRNTVVEMGKDSHTLSDPKLTLAEWWLQKRRHLTTSSYYRWGSKLLLGFYLLSSVLFYMSFVGVMTGTTLYWYALGGLLLKWLVHLSITTVVLRVLDEHDLLLFSLVGDLFSPFFNMAVAISNRIKPPVRWR